MVTIPALVAWATWKLVKYFSPQEQTKREREAAIDAFKRELANEFAAREAERQRKLRADAKEKFESWRDADTQDRPFEYIIGRHALETLSLRYGIPHLTKNEYGKVTGAKSIRIQKIKYLEKDRYLSKLPDYRDREVIAVIEKGTDFVKTFYPICGEEWFERNKSWEDSLKGNRGFTIKDMARMHVDRLNALATRKSEG